MYNILEKVKLDPENQIIAKRGLAKSNTDTILLVFQLISMQC